MRIPLLGASIIAMFIALTCQATEHSPNLLKNSGFEFFDTNTKAPDDWTCAMPSGCTCGTDMAVAKSGRAALRLTVAESVKPDWRTISQPLAMHAKSGTPYTLSAWVKTQDLRDGIGAYISLSFHAPDGERISFSDSKLKIRGTADWQFVSTTASVPKGAAELRSVLCGHGHGIVWFDDVQLEQADAPTPYQTSALDRVKAERLMAQARTTEEWLRSIPSQAAEKKRIAILDMGPQAKAAITDQTAPGMGCCPSDPAVLAAAFNRAGYTAVLLDSEQASNPILLTPKNIDLLVLPFGNLFPASAREALLQFLKQGGLFLSTGGYAFDRLVIQSEGKWYDPLSSPIGNAMSVAVLDAGTAGWSMSSSRGEPTPALHAVAGPAGAPAWELHTSNLQAWATGLTPPVAQKLPADWSITRFRAKGDQHTPMLAIEWHETDGSRWKKLVPLTTQWQEYILFASDFAFWKDGSNIRRGGAGDQLQPEQAKRLMFGVSADMAEPNAAHSVWIADIRVQKDAARQMRKTYNLNTRYGLIRDAIHPTPEQIGVFDSSFPLRFVVKTRPTAGQSVITDFTLDGSLAGYSAMGMLGVNGHGFDANRARWQPLLDCVDAFDRPRGHAGAILHHFDGTFRGSSWGIFGVTNYDLFAQGSPALDQVLLPVAHQLLRRLYLHETDTAYACYHAGETVTLRTKISNFSKRRNPLEVRFVITPSGATAPCATLAKPVEVNPAATCPVTVEWKPQGPVADFYSLVAELWEQGRKIDAEEAGFVLWSPNVIAHGPVIHKDGSRFLLNGRPQFLMGCQTYWGQNKSVTARSPLAFDRDFRQMRDYGFTWTRCFIPFKTEEDKRISDAIVQLAQKYGIVLYHTPNLVNTADPTQLAEQQATAREIAERYHDVPGLTVDICNEPAFSTSDAGLLKAYGKKINPEGAWGDREPRELLQFMTQVQRHWATANCQAIHAGNSNRLASVGWSQNWGGGTALKDPLVASLDLDFTDRHYYGKPDGLSAELKDLDLRGLGKPLVLGECGSKNHPTFQTSDPWGMKDDDNFYDYRFLYLGHHALGLGAAVMSSWHLRDPMEGIFPCGILHPTGTPRPTALLYRAMAMAFSRFKPVATVPQVYVVLPDASRNSGQRQAIVRAFHRASDILVSCGVDFSLFPDSALDRLPPMARTLIYPVPLDPSDDVINRLLAFVQKGGALYISGDISYDAQCRPTKRERLIQLCGIETAGQPTTAPLATPPSAGPARPAADSEIAAWEARPFLPIKLAGAETVVACNDKPMVTCFKKGKGQVWFSAEPLELSADTNTQASNRDLYRAFLRAAGTPALAVTPSTPELHAFHVPGEDADAWVFHNSGPATEVTAGAFTLALATHGSGFLLVGQDNAVHVLEAQGRVTRQGIELANITGHAFVIAMDDLPIEHSREILVLPLTAGNVILTSTLPANATAEIGEIRDGRWRQLAPLACKISAGQLSIAIPQELSREMIRVTAP